MFAIPLTLGAANVAVYFFAGHQWWNLGIAGLCGVATVLIYRDEHR